MIFKQDLALLLLILAFPNSGNGQSLFADQPKSVRLEQFNWSASYWPSIKGGLNHRRKGCARAADCLSPAEKLDHITQHRFGFQEWVKGRNRDAMGIQKFWSGYCASVSTLQMTFPQLNLKPIEFKDDRIGFLIYPDDLIAMAALAIEMDKIESKKTEVLGNRCGISGALKFLARNVPGCNDLSALDFHRLLTERVANGETFAADFHQYAWIDNGVITGYDLETEGQGSNQVKVVAHLFTHKIKYQMQRDLLNPTREQHTYRYTLTLENGIPVSATWDNQKQPDFLWRRTATTFIDEFSFLNFYFNQYR